MPELHNIQTFVKLDNSTTFSNAVAKFAEVLKNSGIKNGTLYKLLNSYKWQVEDNGFVYPEQPHYYITQFSSTPVRPLIIGYTPKIDLSFNENWVSLELLVKTEEVEDKASDLYLSSTLKLVKSLSFELHKQFKDTGVYFTNESQDGNDFKGLREQDNSLLWQFDYAIIPNNFKSHYGYLPENYKVIEHSTFFEAYNMQKWNTT